MRNKKLLSDILILSVSVIFTVLMDRLDIVLKLEQVITSEYILAFVAGIFFISFFTVVPSSFILINLSANSSLLDIALIAGLGAMIGDLIIFLFVKERLSNNFFDFLKFKDKGYLEKLKNSRMLKYFLPVLGAAIVASPLPDEIGVALMGASKMKRRYFIPISYLLNAIGIYLLLLASSSLSQ